MEKQLTDPVLESAGALVVVLDACGKVVRFNRAWEAVSEYTSEEIHGQYVWEQLLIPEEKQAVKSVFQQLASHDYLDRARQRPSVSILPLFIPKISVIIW